MIPEQDGYGSLQVGTQSGETCEYSWSVAVQVGSVYIYIYIICNDTCSYMYSQGLYVIVCVCA